MSRALPKETYDRREVELLRSYYYVEHNARRLSFEINTLLCTGATRPETFSRELEQARVLLRDISDNAMNKRLAIEYEHPQDVDSDR